MSARIIYYVYIVHSDCIIRNAWGFDSEDDANRVKHILTEHFKLIYSYRPYVFCKPILAIVYEHDDEIFMNSQRYTLSEVNHRINSLKESLKYAVTADEVLTILGEQPITPSFKNNIYEALMCCFCYCARDLKSPPTHYRYSLHKRIYTGKNIQMAEIKR